MKIVQMLLLFVAILAGCREQPEAPVSSAAGQRRPSVFQKWEAKNIHDYSMEQSVNCFCPHGGQAMQVTVNKDTVTSVMRLSDSLFLPESMMKHYLTVDSLLGVIAYSGNDSLLFTIDAENGVPVRLSVNPQLNSVDGGITYITGNLRTLH